MIKAFIFCAFAALVSSTWIGNFTLVSTGGLGNLYDECDFPTFDTTISIVQTPNGMVMNMPNTTLSQSPVSIPLNWPANSTEGESCGYEGVYPCLRGNLNFTAGEAILYWYRVNEQNERCDFIIAVEN